MRKLWKILAEVLPIDEVGSYTRQSTTGIGTGALTADTAYALALLHSVLSCG
jgi:hypothetical protein